MPNGLVRSSPSDLKPPSTVASRGTLTKAATSARNRILYSVTMSGSRPRSIASLLIAKEPALIGEGERGANREQDHADRAAEPDAHAGEPVGVEEAHHRLGRVRRTALRQRHHHVEELERADDGEEYRQADGRIEVRDHHVAQHLPAGGTVEMRRLHLRAVKALKRRDEEHHMEAEVLPHDNDEDRRHGGARAGGEVRRLRPEHAVDRG